MPEFSIKMQKEKETKNAVRYQEVVEDGGSPKVDTQYVKKAAFEGEPPEQIEVIVKY